jgi:diketogulonate reductase-like aldo/keto reductase
MVDTAAFYRNEKAIGDALKDIFARKVISRSEIFVTTKLWYSEHGYDLALKAFDESYKKLGLEYVDLYLIHWYVFMISRFNFDWKKAGNKL